MSNPIQNRYDFVLFFDVQDGNPNGDPDAGNLPRIDPETGHGLVTDVCIKRKVRNFVQLEKGCAAPNDIYVKEKAVLGRAHVKAFKELGIRLGEESTAPIEKGVYEWLEENGTPPGVTVEADEENGTFSIIVAADADKKEVKEWLKDAKPAKVIKDAMNTVLKGAKSRRPNGEEVEQGRVKMCQDYYDIRTFGGVLSLKSAPNCGQVRGPVQFTFARSIDQIVPLEHSITRMAVATEAEAEKQQGDNRTMGRKFTVPYALYRCHGFISAPLAVQTGFNEYDLELFWQAVINMFEHDRSAARGLMSSRKLFVFKHDNKMGNAPAHKLFDLIDIKRAEGSTGPARSFHDYTVSIGAVPSGVALEEKL
ncbi:type I-C CRISPR-associated protein Cas7/Csd2 [Desulfococcus sp.]|uniref:type I-C CRISPR-associated protein Cas7/Csd2 n=1 Tax=Desulfococcus sp. TaxID=2025834 RepID=UPI003594750E